MQLSSKEAKDLRNACEYAIRAHPAALTKAYGYAHVGLSVADAVYSIGVNYGGVGKVVDRLIARFELPHAYTPPHISRSEQQSVSEFLKALRGFSSDELAESVFDNRQWTSTGGSRRIRKAEAVVRFAEVLVKHGVAQTQDVPHLGMDVDFDRDIRAIPGQGSGLSLKYFFMLSGDEDLVKPDRMIHRFLTRVLGRSIASDEAVEVIRSAASSLKDSHPILTPRRLDHAIWNEERRRP